MPETWFVECATGMTFGRVWVPAGPSFGISPPRWSIEKDGLPQAVRTLGFRCRTWHGASVDDASDALDRLREAVAVGPAMLGPVDFGYLSYHRGAAGMAGFDHYVVGLALTDEGLLLHDPAGAPYAMLPVPDLLDAWRADAIAWRLGPYTLRSHFERVAAPTRPAMIAAVLPSVRANVHAQPVDPANCAGAAAIRALARTVSDGPPEALERNLVVFALPTVTRRAIDGARFLAEAGLPAAAHAMAREAALWGQASSAVSRRDWPRAAELLDQLADADEELAAAL
jgi:hypothetical protein